MRHIFSYFDSGTPRKRKKRREASESPERSMLKRLKARKKNHSMDLDSYAPLYNKEGMDLIKVYLLSRR